MNMSRAVSVGYDVPNLCPLCGEEGDTIFHRVFRCKHTRVELKNAVPKWFRDEVHRRLDEATFFTTGFFLHPMEDGWHRPSKDLVFDVIVIHQSEGELEAGRHGGMLDYKMQSELTAQDFGTVDVRDDADVVQVGSKHPVQHVQGSGVGTARIFFVCLRGSSPREGPWWHPCA